MTHSGERTDLVAWLTQILDEDEAVALSAEHSDGPDTLRWTKAGGQRHHRFDNGCTESYTAVKCGDWERILIARDGVGGGALASHVAAHDPAAVLADIAAKRGLIEEASKYRPGQPGYGMAAQAVKLMASAYADRPGYDEIWRP